MDLQRSIVALAALSTICLLASPARADVESWNWVEVRVPFSEGQHGLPNSFRLVTDARYAGRYEGLGQIYVRMGPVWELHPNLSLAAHLTAQTDLGAGGTHEQEHRLELEPTIRGQRGDFSWSDRNRLEYRHRQRSAGTSDSWRYRNRVRVNYAPPGSAWFPFVSDEVFVDLSGQGLNQNRLSMGLGRVLNESSRLEVGYGFRSRLASAGGWEHDHLALASFFFAPKVAPLLMPDAGPAD